jgi:hypothetical protein
MESTVESNVKPDKNRARVGALSLYVALCYVVLCCVVLFWLVLSCLVVVLSCGCLVLFLSCVA